MSPVRTQYLPLWQPPPFRPSVSTGRRIPRGTGAEEGGPIDLIGRITVMVRPAGQVTVGQQVTFTAVRTGGGAPLTYQWSGPSGVIPGATGNSYTFAPTAPTDSGTYTVTVTSAGATDGPVSSGVAITVVAPPAVADRWLMEDSGFILMEAGGNFLLET